MLCPAFLITSYVGDDTAFPVYFLSSGLISGAVCPPRSSALVLFQTPSQKGCARQFATQRAGRAFGLSRAELRHQQSPRNNGFPSQTALLVLTVHRESSAVVGAEWRRGDLGLRREEESLEETLKEAEKVC